MKYDLNLYSDLLTNYFFHHKDINIPLMIDGILNPIFSMSSQDILLDFKITLEDILNNYYNKHLEKSRLVNLLNS